LYNQSELLLYAVACLMYCYVCISFCSAFCVAVLWALLKWGQQTC